jgi:hypothetical protein
MIGLAGISGAALASKAADAARQAKESGITSGSDEIRLTNT